MNEETKTFNDFLNRWVDLDIRDYFNLHEEEKQKISSVICKHYDEILSIEPKLIWMYLQKIGGAIKRQEEQEIYEVADIFTRVYNHLNENYSEYKYYPKED
jgi:hypothetical protein